MGGRGASSMSAVNSTASFQQYISEPSNFDTITRKQAGVIFRNYKDGNIDATKQQIDLVYTRFVSEGISSQSNDANMINSASNLRTVVNALFANDYPAANAAFAHFLDFYYMRNKDEWFPDDRKGR